MPRNNSKAQREYRFLSAETRRLERAQREPGDQLELLESRPGFSNKETHRLLIAAKASVDAMNATVKPKPKRTRKREVNE